MEDQRSKDVRKLKKTHPFVKANFFSKIFFTWMFPTFKKGFRNDLLEDDLFPALQSHDSTYLGNKIELQWQKELKRRPKNPSLWRALARVFGKQLALLGILYFFIEICLRIALPLLLAKFLEYFSPSSEMTKSEAYYYGIAIIVSNFLASILHHYYLLHVFHLGMKIRVAASTLVYRKALKLSKSALADTTVGQMVNLISNDVGRFDLVTIHFHNLWTAPLETIIILVILYFYVGPSGMVGVTLLLAFIPFQMWVGKKISTFRLATAIKTDERIRLMNEIISGVQVIKMYTWEKPFAKLVEISRWKEMKEIKKISIMRALMLSFNGFLNQTAIFVCVLYYTISGNTLTAQYVYVLTSFYLILRLGVTMFFPAGITFLAEASISVKRLKHFLLYDEVNIDTNVALKLSEPLKSISHETKMPVGISFKNVCVKWLKSSEENSLSNIKIDVEDKELGVVIGPVGSGKTTLLHAILGELPPTSGTINVNGRISYASQEPWLFVGSVRQNITFGQKFDAKRYYEVVRVCALQRDFSLFPYGDRTIVGERGVSLSGGQKARINLARAIYKDADIYLLDDPLSAVDAHVGREIFDECITGYLKNKCVVLVTHQLQYLKNVKNIYLLGKGKIDHSGTYDEIQNSGNEFSQLLNELKDIIDDEEKTDEKIEADEIEPELRRRLSTKEVVPKTDKDPTLEKEGRGSGTVTWNVYKSYLISGGHWLKILTLFLIFIIVQALTSFCDYYLTIWVNMNQVRNDMVKYGIKQTNLEETTFKLANTTFNSLQQHFKTENINVIIKDSIVGEKTSFQSFWFTYMTNDIIVYTYSTLIIGLILLTIGRSLYFYRFCNKASVRLHNNMFYKIVYATMRFFNTNPSGRILNRFSKDMNQVDEVLPLTLMDTVAIFLNVIAITAMVAIVNPWMLVPTLVMLTIFYFMRVVFLATSRDIKRLEGTTRSPVYSHLTASLQGLTTIRAFGAQETLKQEFDNYQNAYSSAYFMFLGANRTFGFWLDMHCLGFIALATLGFLFFDNETFAGNVGLVITQSANLVGMFQWGMRQWSELENTMTCVERIKEYADVVPEKDLTGKDPPKSWPQRGNVKFDNLKLRYAIGEPLVLKGLTFSVKSTEKVGIVGRTGAGKSSIINALFRLAINEGKILIDDVDTSSVTLNRLRSSISIIPQEPVLFSGSLRKNLDPFDQYTDDDLWSALEEVELKSAVAELQFGLGTKISEGGSNFSVGQRQLVCLARAIVRKNKVLVMDEATANVDPQTDALIQSTIRKKFSDCTVLTIAHRLHTIMDSDKVLVMDSGKVVEFGTPYELLQNKSGGVFYELVQQTGKAMAEILTNVANQSYNAEKN